MLEGPSFHYSRDLPSSSHCEQERNWMYDGFSLMESSNFKRKSEDGENNNIGKSLKLLKLNKAGEMEVDFLNLSLSLVVTPSNNVGDDRGGERSLVVESNNIDLMDHGGEPCVVVDSSENVDHAGEEFFVVGSNSIDFIDHAGERSLVVESNSIDFIDHGGELSFVVDSSEFVDHGGEHSDTSSLIPEIRRDNSIDCIARCSRSDYGSIAGVNRSFRDLIESKELYRLRREIGNVEHWIYFSCSLREWEVFDPIRLRWKHLPVMPSNDCFMHSDKESLAVGTELLVFGKEVTSHLIYKYSLLTNSWSSAMEMNTPRCLFGSATLGEKAIVAGGCDLRGNIFASAELYNSETGTWVTLPSMNKARKKCSAVFMDGKFYVIGGLGVENSNPLTCGEVYDLERRTWTEIPNMLPLRNAEPGEPEAYAMSEAPPLLAVVNNELYAADYARKEVRKYNKSSNSWATVGSLPEMAVSTHGWGLAFRGCGDKLIVLGGPRGPGYVEVNSWAPSESPQQWTLLGRAQSGGFVYNCAIMGC